MAAAGDIQDLSEEATCPICLDYFRDPVTIPECGHNFCQGCLAQSWGQEESDDLEVSCPLCRKTTLRKSLIPNRALKNMVEIAKKLSLGGQKETRGEGRFCEKHQEPLKLFCRNHQVPICVVCDRSKEHKKHKVVPLEEAFQEHKNQVCSRMKTLRAEKEKILRHKGNTEKESQDLLNQTEEKRQKTMAEFQQMHQFLEEKEKILLAQIEEVEKEIARRRDEHLARLCREISSLENLIHEMEEKSQQPASEFLQDIRKTLQRYEKKDTFKNPVAFPPELTSRIREFSYKKPPLEGVMKLFEAANVTLDPDTAHACLILSEDCKSIITGGIYQDLPDNPERFIFWPCVLGLQGFTTGRHLWEVTVGSEGDWAVGVARKSVKRKGMIPFSPEEGIWAVGKREKTGSDKLVISTDFTLLSQSPEHQRIQVTLNCDEGQVSFSDADTGVHLYTYVGASFCGETLFPFFYVSGKAHLRLSP